ncbi:MAG: response regulator [Clostridium sp.]|nr:response regulator [Clostridium sp.]
MYRLLIADDEMIERMVLYKTLHKNLGDRCAIFQAENGREVLRIYEEEKIQIAILDIEMPGIGGIEAAQRIREKDKDCCIIFLTAFDEFSYAKKAIMIRALDYLLKPYDEQELMLVMEEAMRLTDEHLADSQPSRSAKQSGANGAAAQKHGPRGQADAHEAQDDLEEDGNIRLSKVAEIIDRYIHENYMYDISMQELARTMNYSEPYFCKLFKQCFGKNFTSYLTEFRVEEAKKMLKQPTVNVKEIGKAVGYGDSNYFAKVFKRITGQSPTEYRLCIFQGR